MSSPSLERAKHLQRAIREGLMQEWDPIGVKDIPEAGDEYGGYVGQIYQLLDSGAPVEEVFKFLWWVETEHMGLPGDRATTERFAHRLVELRQGIDPR
jgi:hypothetical protein